MVFHRECGATVISNTQVSVIPTSDSLPDTAGNVLTLEGTAELDVSWLAEDQLRISGVKGQSIFRQERAIADIQIVYK